MAKDAKNNKDVKNKKHFFKDFKAELKKVIWPTPKQIVNNTIAVITIVIIAAVLVFIFDVVFKLINDKGVDSIKSNIKNKKAVESVVEEDTEKVEDDETEVITTEDGVTITTTPVNSENEEQNEASTEDVQ